MLFAGTVADSGCCYTFTAISTDQLHIILSVTGCIFCFPQEDIDFEAVSVGAILSDYQRVRVENV